MRILHPVWRGFWLAVMMMAGFVLMGFTDALAPFRGERRMIAFAGAMMAGAFLGALPGRLRKGAASRQQTSWQRCLRAFLGGAGMALALGIAGDGRILPALVSCDPGAVIFGASALMTGFITVRLAERRRA